MKKLLFIFILSSMLFSCNNEDNLASEASTIKLSTNLVFKFPTDTFKLSSEKNDNLSLPFINCSNIVISKWHSSYESDIYHTHNVWQDNDLEMTSSNIFVDDDLTLGYTSYKAEFTRYISSDFSIDKWNEIPIQYKNFNNKLYKRYVGVTRGTVPSNDTDSLNQTMYRYPFIPSNNDESRLWGTDKASAFQITSRDISKAKDNNSNLYDRTIILEMTPVNSIFDIILENQNESLYLGVWAKGKLFLLPPSSYYNKKIRKRAILNLAEITAGSNISCKVLALKLKQNKSIPIANADVSFEMLKDRFTIINGNGEGQNLFPAGEKIVGNQRYYVQDKKYKNKQATIVLKRNDFISNVYIFINCHLSFEDTEIIKEDWDW